MPNSQLVKPLVLHFLKNKTFNLSILQKVCEQQKINASTTIQQIKQKIQIIDKSLQIIIQNSKYKQARKQSQNSGQSILQKQLVNMSNILIFNISATNQHYISQIQKQMIQSTASVSSPQNYKDQNAIKILKNQFYQYFQTFTLKSKFLSQLILNIQQNSRINLNQCQLNFLQTLDYLCVKYSINNHFSKRIAAILDQQGDNMSQKSIPYHEVEFIQQVITLIFTNKKQHQFYQIIQLSSNVNLKTLANLIGINYHAQSLQRKIFSQADISGKTVINNLLDQMIKKINSTQLFNQKMQEYGPFQLFINHLLNFQYPVYDEFNQIVKQMMGIQNLNSGESLKILRKIERFFRITISIQNPQFQKLLSHLYKLLLKTSAKKVSQQLLKKLLLNRFFLNPKIFVQNNQPNQAILNSFVQRANFMRSLFYTAKAGQLSEKFSNPSFNKISHEICQSFLFMLQLQKGNIPQGNSTLYVNDKIIKYQMKMIYEEIKQSNHSMNQGVKIQNLASDYSLSFSLVKNDKQKNNLKSQQLIQNLSQLRQATSNRTNINENNSIRLMYQELKQPSSQTLIPTPNKTNLQLPSQIQINKKTNTTQQPYQQSQTKIENQTRYSVRGVSDRDLIYELVEVRREYGERRVILMRNKDNRQINRKAKIAKLKLFTNTFNQYKEVIQRDNNILYIHMTTIN